MKRKKIIECECGQPAADQVAARRNHGFATGCARCRKLEAEGTKDAAPHSAGVNMKRAGVWDIPRAALIEIRRACDAWLIGRGINPETSHILPSEQ